MWANAQRDGRPAYYRRRPLLNAAVWLTPSYSVRCSNAPTSKQYWLNIGTMLTYWIKIGRYDNILPILAQYCNLSATQCNCAPCAAILANTRTRLHLCYQTQRMSLSSISIFIAIQLLCHWNWVKIIAVTWKNATNHNMIKKCIFCSYYHVPLGTFISHIMQA